MSTKTDPTVTTRINIIPLVNAILFLATVTLAVLKIAGAITIPWIGVFLPLIAIVVLIGVLYVLVIFIVLASK